MKRETVLTLAVVLLLAAGAAWAIHRRTLTDPVRLKSGKVYAIDTAWNDAGY